MSFFTFGKIITCAFFSYFVYSIYSFYNIFYIKQCDIKDSKDLCIVPLFNNEVEYQLTIKGASGNSDMRQLLLIKHMKLNESFTKEVTVDLGRNASYSVHMRLTPRLSGGTLDHSNSVKASLSLSKLQPVSTQPKRLLDHQVPSKDVSTGQWSHHLHTQAFVSYVHPAPILSYRAVPQEITDWLAIIPDSPHYSYKPIAGFQKFYMSSRHVVKPSDDLAINVTFTFSPISIHRLRFFQMMDKAFTDMKELGFSDKNVESIKEIFTDNNIYVLFLTFVISLVHLLFDVLSLKHDVVFWRHIDSTRGISRAAVVWRLVSGCIILAYLMEQDSGRGQASLLVIGPIAFGLLLELWKLLKLHSLPHNKDTSGLSTNDYDTRCVIWLATALSPLAVAGAIYSLLYLEHTSWYSWTIQTLANGVYAFGFLLMTPQLFINYKLKSVDHLPWRSLTYRAFNTFIDDVFAFIITMPTSHRVACFRDDAVFLIYLYQRRLYRVDKSRTSTDSKNLITNSSCPENPKIKHQ